MTHEKDPPIVEQDFLMGVKVVDIGDLRVSRGHSRRPVNRCNHASLVYDSTERRIWCKDCETNIDPFDAFIILTNQCWRAYEDINRRQAALDDSERFSIVSLAAKQIDKIWRKKNVVPACPSCGNGLLPEDFKDGCKSIIGKDFARKLRKQK